MEKFSPLARSPYADSHHLGSVEIASTAVWPCKKYALLPAAAQGQGSQRPPLTRRPSTKPPNALNPLRSTISPSFGGSIVFFFFFFSLFFFFFFFAFVICNPPAAMRFRMIFCQWNHHHLHCRRSLSSEACLSKLRIPLLPPPPLLLCPRIDFLVTFAEYRAQHLYRSATAEVPSFHCSMGPQRERTNPAQCISHPYLRAP